MGVVSSVVFGIRNASKCAHGDKTRGVVAGEQAISALDGVGNFLGKTDGAVESIFGKFGKTEALSTIKKETTGAASNLGAIAQKTINPLLCVAAGARVLKDDDQYSALIEESLAMGTMFGVESVMKYARTATTGGVQATTGMGGKIANLLSKSSIIEGLGEKAGKWFTNLGQGAHGSAKQMIVRAGIDLLFVAGSILAYNLGHKVGEKLSGRSNQKTTQVENPVKIQQDIQDKNLQTTQNYAYSMA